MQKVLNNGFAELSGNDLEMIEGGKSGATRFGQALYGTLVVATTPFVGVLAGIAGGPIAGAVAAASYGGLGLSLIGASTH